MLSIQSTVHRSEFYDAKKPWIAVSDFLCHSIDKMRIKNLMYSFLILEHTHPSPEAQNSLQQHMNSLQFALTEFLNSMQTFYCWTIIYVVIIVIVIVAGILKSILKWMLNKLNLQRHKMYNYLMDCGKLNASSSKKKNKRKI